MRRASLRISLVLPFVLSLAMAPSAAHAQARLLDEVVAVLDLQSSGPRRSILLSEVELSGRLDRALVHGAASLDQELSAAQLEAALATLVDRLVIVGEAERLEVFRLDADEADAALDVYVKRVGRPAFEAWLQRSGQDLETVRDFVLRVARVQRYLEGRFRLAARPRPGEVRERWTQLRRQGASATFDETSAGIETRVEQERFQELVSQFVDDVRRRVNVRVVRDFAVDALGAQGHGTVKAPQARTTPR